jgi:hypothetical protein
VVRGLFEMTGNEIATLFVVVYVCGTDEIIIIAYG